MTVPGLFKNDRRSIILLCILIFAVGFAIRLPGIGWGLKNDLHNQSYHPDEPIIFDFVHGSHLFHPEAQREYYNYGTIFYAVLRTTEVMGKTFGGMTEPPTFDFNKVTSFEEWDAINTYISQFDYWGRLASAFFGALTAALVFLIMRRWVSQLGALAGAGLIMLSPAHVEHSRFQTVDILSLFFVALATFGAVRLLRPALTDNKEWWRDVVLAAVLVGCAASTRYSDGLLALSVMIAIAIRRPKSWPAMIAVVPVIAIIAFCVTTPGVITDTAYFLENFKYQASHANTGHGLVFVGRPSGFVFHFYELMMGISVLGAVVGVAGLLYAVFRKHHWAWVVAAYFIPYYISIGILQVMFLRYDFPLYVGIACGFAYAISAIRRRTNLATGVAAGVISLAGVYPLQTGLTGTVLFTKWMLGTDPRDEAGQYLKDAAKSTPNVAVCILHKPWFWTPAVLKDADYLQMQPPQVIFDYLTQQTRAPVVIPFYWNPPRMPLYATVSSYEYEDVQRLRGMEIPPEFKTGVEYETLQLDDFNSRYQTIATFGEGGPTIHDLEYIQPTVLVMKRKD